MYHILARWNVLILYASSFLKYFSSKKIECEIHICSLNEHRREWIYHVYMYHKIYRDVSSISKMLQQKVYTLECLEIRRIYSFLLHDIETKKFLIRL